LVAPKVAKQGFWLRFNHSWEPRVVPIRNFQTVSLGSSVYRDEQSMPTQFQRLLEVAEPA
jgi:hypothetical protein